MTPQEFSGEVLPRVVSAWERMCFCSSPGFVKLMSFDFSRYGTTPVALYDQEALGDEIITKRFTRITEPVPDPRSGTNRHIRQCPACGRRCEVVWDQYSINFDRAYYDFGQAEVAIQGIYLVGFYGFRGNWSFPDYKPGTTIEFLAAIGAG